MSDSKTTLMPSPSKTREFFKSAGMVMWVLLVLYVVYYWILWRGGKYVYTTQLLPYLDTIHNDQTKPGVAIELYRESAKFIWTAVGALVTGIVGTLVRRWFVFEALKGKIKLLDKIRIGILDLFQSGISSDPIKLAISAGSVKFLFGEKEFINIGKYIDPSIAMMILNTIAAMDLLASMARLSDGGKELSRIAEGALTPLRQFNLEDVLANLTLSQLNTHQAAEDAAEKAAT